MDLFAEAQQSLDAAIRSNFLTVVESGFIYNGTAIKSTQALGRYVEGTLTSRCRRLVIGYMPPDNERKEVLLVHIENMEGDTFAVPDYLRHIGIKDVALDISQYEGSLRVRISSALNANSQVLLEHLPRVILGQEWARVPIDWGDYK